MAGRPPKPTALKVLEGNPGKRQLNDREPQASAGKPKRPTWLAVKARPHWQQAIQALEGMGVLTVADGPAVALLANALVEYIDAAQEVEDRGLTFLDERLDKDGNVISSVIRPNPATTVRADAWRRVNLMLQQFGLTASSRSKVKLEKPEEDDGFANWESRRRSK